MKASEIYVEAVNPRNTIVEVRDIIRKWLSSNPEIEVQSIQISTIMDTDPENGHTLPKFAAFIVYRSTSSMLS